MMQARQLPRCMMKNTDIPIQYAPQYELLVYTYHAPSTLLVSCMHVMVRRNEPILVPYRSPALTTRYRNTVDTYSNIQDVAGRQAAGLPFFYINQPAEKTLLLPITIIRCLLQASILYLSIYLLPAFKLRYPSSALRKHFIISFPFHLHHYPLV